VDEPLRDLETQQVSSQSESRKLGLVIVRGTALVVISPVNGMEEIANPFNTET